MMSDVVELGGEARFELKRQLADTLQGRIYSAIDRNTGEFCVVKETWRQLVKLGKSRDGHSVPENFEEEKRILKYLSSQKDSHAGFVRLIDEWEDKDCYLYAMEMCRGGELFEFIKGMHSDGAVAHYTRQQSRLKQEAMNNIDTNEWIKVVQHMFSQIVSCTSWMHSKGVCHLDLSLENAMIANRSKKYGNQIKIIDFGLAKYYPDNKFVNNKRVGKTGYMAPEVFARKKYDPRAADIWSLGVMLFMMLIGAPPYQLPTPSNPAFNFIVNGRLRDVLKHWKRLRCINKDALDLLNKIFKYESKRITMDQILKHPFIIINNNNNNTVTNTNNSNTNINTNINTTTTSTNDDDDTKPKTPPSAPQEGIPATNTTISNPTNTDTNTNTNTSTNININSYTFTTEIAKKFASQLENNLPPEQLKIIMREVEQRHNSMQEKADNKNKNKNKNKSQQINESESKLQEITMKELHIIHTNVEQQLDRFNIDQQSKHKVERYKSNETPHNN